MTTQCYGIDGTPYATFDRYIPCNVTAAATGGHTACCAPGDNCLSNGFCQSPVDNKRKANVFWRNGCTDPTWKDKACPRYCEGEGDPATHAVFYCLKSNSWCCPNGLRDVGQVVNTTCCTINNLVFSAPDPAIYTSAELNFMSTVNNARPTSAAQSSLSSIAFASSSAASTANQPTAPANNTSGSSSTPPSNSDSKMGIYVGVPLGILLAIALAVIAWLAIQNRKLKKAHLAPHEMPGVSAPYYADKPVAEMRAQPGELMDREVAAEMPDNRWR